MRLTLAIFIGLILTGATYGQAGDDPEHVIRRIVDSGLSEGHDQKIIGHLGDAGAVLLTKILAGREPTLNTIENALVVVDGAFADPSLVEALDDRKPRTTLLLLRYLDLSTNDATLKKHIAGTSKYVQGRYNASLKSARP